jgi:hypothetical protein
MAETPTSIGAIVMALGIFVAASLRQLPDGVFLMKPMAAVLLFVWVVIAAKLLLSLRHGGLPVHTNSVTRMFGIGTWVAGTAIVATVWPLPWPATAWITRGFSIASFALWLSFFPVAVKNLARLVLDRKQDLSGGVLLTTVATQALALIGFQLFAEISWLRWTAALLMALGAAAYPVGLYLVVRRYWARSGWSLAIDWDNTNCILHGALSITGLTAVASGFFGASIILAFWTCVLLMFAAVEAIELMRLGARIRTFGWCGAVRIYDVSQWARNFTFGMLYAFTLAFAQRFNISDSQSMLGAVRNAVVAYGQYVVLALLLVELALAVIALLNRTPRDPVIRDERSRDWRNDPA